jgi:DNA polymerase III subunit gamma/tau
MGQSLVVKSLTTAITKGKIAPEYLFVGPDGTDKKTTAIIFAEALICHNTEPHCQPCGLCRECATFTLNRSSNVKEIDVASNLEVDGMRTVLHRMTFSPFSSHYRVFIVEGCEVLSADKWNMFLKFWDDPPRNVFLILITTNPDCLPLTATSRF